MVQFLSINFFLVFLQFLLGFSNFPFFLCHSFCINSRELVTDSMAQNPPWEAVISSASQETPRILWNPTIHYRIHRSPPSFPVLSQINPFPLPASWISILMLSPPYTHGPSWWSLSLMFPHQNPVCISHTYYIPRPSHCSWFDRPNNTCWC